MARTKAVPQRHPSYCTRTRDMKGTDSPVVDLFRKRCFHSLFIRTLRKITNDEFCVQSSAIEATRGALLQETIEQLTSTLTALYVLQKK